MSYHTITIFSDVSHSSHRPTSFGVSALVHGFAFGLLTFGIMQSPRVVNDVRGERYLVRRLELDTLEHPKLYNHDNENADRTGSAPKDSSVAAALQAYLQPSLPPVGSNKSRGTLVQPDVPIKPALLKELEIP